MDHTNLVEVLGDLAPGVRTMMAWIRLGRAIRVLEPALVAVTVDSDIEKYL